MSYFSKKCYWLCLLGGAVALFFINGKFNIPIAAWLVFVLFLFASRKSEKPVKGILLIALVTFVSVFLHSNGAFQLGFPLDGIGSGLMSLILVLPYIVDRIFFPMFIRDGSVGRKFAGTLIFPAAYATLEAAMNFYPAGPAFCLSLSQVENLPFIQIGSIFGQMGLAFLVAWFGSLLYFVIDYLMENGGMSAGEIWKSLKKPVCVAFAIYLAVFAYGGARLVYGEPDGDMVKVALAQGPEAPFVNGEYQNASFEENTTHAKAAIKEAAGGGAELVMFNEEAFFMTSDHKAEMTELLCKEAKETGMYIVAGYEVEDINGKELPDNMIIGINPDGKVMYEYTKTILVPVVEDGYYQEGDGKINTVEMSLGSNDKCKVSAAICYEGTFTHYMNQISADTDIHLNPSWEWAGIGNTHNHTLPMRAVEHGFSLIKSTYESENIACDYQGRARVYANPQYCGYDSVNFAYLPVEGVITVYGHIGKVMDWIYAAGLIVLVILALSRRRACSK